MRERTRERTGRRSLRDHALDVTRHPVDAADEVGTRERILATAATLFTEQGYDATSLREIADDLGFTKAALYYHFKSKAEILEALLSPLDGLLQEFLGRLEAAPDTVGWAEVLEWVVGQMFELRDVFQLAVRNRASVEAHNTAHDAFAEHHDFHTRIEAAVRAKTDDLGEQVRMIAALGAVTGFDDWAPGLLLDTDLDDLRTELLAAVRDILGLSTPKRRARPRSNSTSPTRT